MTILNGNKASTVLLATTAIVYVVISINQFRFDSPNLQRHFHLDAFRQHAKVTARTNRTHRSNSEAKGYRKANRKANKKANNKANSNSNSSIVAQQDYRLCPMNNPWPRTETHGCVASELTKIIYCQFENLRIDIAKVNCVKGGEMLSTVMGRSEDVEFPKYTLGAFQTKTTPNIPTTLNKDDMYYIQDVVNSLETKEPQHCETTIPGITMFIARYEYCNLYHTMTDWWNTFLALPTPSAAKSMQLVLLDGHAEGSLDAVWSAIFANVTFVQQLPKGGVCFEKAILIPPGYMSHLWPRYRTWTASKRCPDMTEAFVQFMVQSLGLEHVQRIPGLVLLIDRIPYIGHPRSNPGNAKRIIQNMADVRDRLANQTNAKEVRLVQFEKMTFREQLELIRSAHVMIGNHGAGIAHLTFLQDGTHVLEFQQPASTMMTDFSAWKPKIKHTLLPAVNSLYVSNSFIQDSLLPALRDALNGSSAKNSY